jgi:molybdopterin-guanine dinucleotide biosynthesis protein A
MVLGLILAGGRSQRFGSEKALAELAGVSLLERAHRRLSAVCAQVAVSGATPGAAALAERLDAPLLADPPGAPRGPLSGVLAGLDWAAGRRESLLLVLPCDTPLLPADLEARLLAEIGGAPAAAARAPDGLQPLCALWRTALARALRAALADGLHPPAHQVLTDAGAVETIFPDAAAFLNVNTTADLAEAERRLALR